MRIKGISNESRRVIHLAYEHAGADIGPVKAVNAYGNHFFGSVAEDGTWRGDSCGCPDDRCIGHHHAPEDDCLCVRTLAQEAATAYVSEQDIRHTSVIGTAVRAVHRAETDLLTAVRHARQAGVSWRSIGDALGTSGPAAHQKYSKLV